jgi:hypothetical protein
MHHIFLAITFVGVTALVFAALVALEMALG